MQRYFINQEILNTVEIMGSDFHHIKNVMRMKVGDKVYLSNNDSSFIAQIDAILNDKVILKVLEKVNYDSETPFKVTIAQGLVRREKKEEVIRRITELGAFSYIPVIMDRSIVKYNGDDKLERGRTIIKEACEQSHRNHLMELNETISLKDLISKKDNYDLCLFAYEESGRSSNFKLKSYLKQFKNDNKETILVVIGPEGGFSEKEVKTLLDSNFKAVGLGPRILRTETAPLYVMSAISYELELKEEE